MDALNEMGWIACQKMVNIKMPEHDLGRTDNLYWLSYVNVIIPGGSDIPKNKFAPPPPTPPVAHCCQKLCPLLGAGGIPATRSTVWSCRAAML